MPIFVGTSDIDDITLGGATTGFHSVWKGSTRIWARPLLYDLNVAIFDPTPHIDVTQYGYDSPLSQGSLDFVSGHNQYTSDWFRSFGGQSHSQYVRELSYYDYASSGITDNLFLRIGSTATTAQGIPNTDATFNRLTVNGNLFTRSSATYQYNTGSNFTSWRWYNASNPFSGVSAGTDVKIRFDKP